MDMGIGRIPEGLEQTGFGDWKPDVWEREESRASPFMACHGACKRPGKEEMVSQGEMSGPLAPTPGSVSKIQEP